MVPLPKMISDIYKAIDQARQNGYTVGTHFNAVIIPTSLLEEFEKNLNNYTLVNSKDSKFEIGGLEVLICAKADKIRFGKIF